MRRNRTVIGVGIGFLVLGMAGLLEAATPIPRLTRGPVSFENEILPILQANCLPCHNRQTAKADLNLETPTSMLKGGDSGPAVMPKRGERSLLLRVAAHAVEPFMPPKGNKANAVDLTPDELGLIRLWIDQGAKAGAVAERTIAWQPVAENVQGIGAVALSSDGRFVACGRANTVIVYDLATQGQQRCEVRQQPNRDLIGAVAFSPDGILLAAGGYREVRLWRRVARPVRTLPRTVRGEPASTGLPGVTDGSLNTNGLRISIEGTNGVRLVRGRAGELVRVLATGSVMVGADLAADGGRVVTVGADGGVSLWSVADGSRLADLSGNPGERWQRLELEDARVLARADQAHFTNVLARATTNLTQSVEREKKAQAAVEKASKALEEKVLALAKAREALAEAEQQLAGLAVPGELFATLESAQAAVTQVAARLKAAEDRKDGAALPALKEELAATRSGEARAKAAFEAIPAADRDRLAKARTKVQEQRKPVEEATQQLAIAERVKGTAEHELELAAKARGGSEGVVKEAESSLASSAAHESQVIEQLGALAAPAKEVRGSPKRATVAAFDPSGRFVVVGASDGSLSAWDAKDGVPIDQSRPTKKSVERLEFDGGQVRAFDAGGRCHSWDLQPAWEWVGNFGDGSSRSPITDRVAALAFSPDGRLLATGGGQPTRGGEILIWDVAKRKVALALTNVHSDQVFAVAWSPDGRHLASGGADRFARVVEVATSQVVKNLEGHTHYVLGVAWRRDGRVLASAGAEGVIKTWDVASGDRLKNLTGQDKEVTAVGFLGIRGELVAVSGDPRVRVFKEDGGELRVLEAGPDFLAAGAVDWRGRRIAAGGPEGVLRVWDVGQAQPIAVLPPPSQGK